MLQQVARYEAINQQNYKPRGTKTPFEPSVENVWRNYRRKIAQKESEEHRLQQQYQQISQIQKEIAAIRRTAASAKRCLSSCSTTDQPLAIV